MISKDKKIGVLYGGVSKERDVSLRSGAAVSSALRKKGYDVVEIDVQVGLSGVQKIIDARLDVAFIVLHGRLGEDGAIQGFLEMARIPYTGSGVLPSAIAMDKDFTKHIVRSVGVRTPFWTVLTEGSEAEVETIKDFPVIVKPSQEGSTIGMSIVKNQGDLSQALTTAFRFDPKVLVEQYIVGREVTVTVLDGKALPIIEVVPKSGFYDFTSKYTKGMTEYRVPASLSENLQSKIITASEKIFSLLSLSGCARLDFMIDAQEQEYFLEVNTLPGMTETSLAPKAAASRGLSFEDLCESILKTASLKEKIE